MQTWIVLLRGINVGGKNSLPMATLRNLLESIGCTKVETYIQSGNVLCSSSLCREELAAQLATAIEGTCGFRPAILILHADELRTALTQNPFPEGCEHPKTVHLYFLARAPVEPDMEGLAALAVPSERFELRDTVFYMHGPDGFGNSKLAAGAEKKLGVTTTARNLATVTKLVQMLNESAGA